MSEIELVDQLQNIGLTEYQSRAYVAAVSLGTATPGELADESGVPQARIYDVIEDLTERGFVEEQIRDGTKVVSAPEPGVVLEEFKNRHVDEFNATVQSAAADLSRMYQRETNTDGFVSMVSLEKSARRHIRRAIDDADWWLALSLPRATYDSVADEVEAAIDRGVTVRLVVHDDTAPAEELDDSFPADVHVRRRSIADTLAVADRSYGVFSSELPHADSSPYIVTQEANLVFLFQNYFQQFWSTSEVVQTGDAFPRWYLDPWRVITDLGSELEETAFTAHVVGYRSAESRDGEWTGEVIGSELAGPVEADFTSALPVRATLRIDTGDEILAVGGWKAAVEDVAASAIRLERTA
ncbi:TrmB family transcriptional regulator [Halorussus salinisoli]|uniref:TrmB family transcriptional regulator n=1 Tax=Halorussus salinisoli TaxID=2558242 RepID=UPI0014855B41|nr:TrmB family transcriptional regulator [Halorussus salinisoli]